MASESKTQLYPDPQPPNYIVEVDMTTPVQPTHPAGQPQPAPQYQPQQHLQPQPLQQPHYQVVQPEVQHHSTTAEEDESESCDIDENSPGDVPQRYINLEFKATFHEHKKTSVVKPVHDVLGIIYKWIKLVTYHFFVFLIGIPVMILWAFVNGITAFVYSWLYSPALRLTIFWVAATIPLITMPLVTIFRPLVDVAARCLSKISLKGSLEGKGFVKNV